MKIRRIGLSVLSRSTPRASYITVSENTPTKTGGIHACNRGFAKSVSPRNGVGVRSMIEATLFLMVVLAIVDAVKAPPVLSQGRPRCRFCGQEINRE
jgi:hypothetical protein